MARNLLLDVLSRSEEETIRFGERDITHMPAHEIVGLGVSQAPEGRMVFANLSVEDNLAFQSRIAGKHDAAWHAELTERLGLGKLFGRRGDKRMIRIFLSLIGVELFGFGQMARARVADCQASGGLNDAVACDPTP